MPFTVKTIDTDGVVLLLGRMKNPVRLTWACLEGVVRFIENHGGNLPIGVQHTVEGQPGTLDEYLKTCTKVNTARWAAALLEAAGIVEIIRERPSRSDCETDY